MEIAKESNGKKLFSYLYKTGIAITVLSVILLLYQFLVKLNHPVNEPSIPNEFVIVIFIGGILLSVYGNYKMGCKSQRKTKRKKVNIVETQSKQIIKPIQVHEIASWKSDGMRQYVAHAKYELNMYIRDIEIKLKNITQQERELYIIHDLIMKLMQELISDEITLSCADIYLIFNKLEVYHVHHEKRLYESYKVNLSIAQQYKLDLMLDIKTREVLRFLLKERYAFLPDGLSDHLSEAVRSMEIAADKGNVFAQFDLANVYLSSEFYGGMEAAIFYLHRAESEHHSGAEQLLHQLQHA